MVGHQVGNLPANSSRKKILCNLAILKLYQNLKRKTVPKNLPFHRVSAAGLTPLNGLPYFSVIVDVDSDTFYSVYRVYLA